MAWQKNLSQFINRGLQCLAFLFFALLDVSTTLAMLDFLYSYNSKNDEISMADLTKVDDFLSGAIAGKNFAVVEKLFNSLDTDKVSMTFLVGLLRFSFPARECIGNWKDFLNRCMEESDKRGRDTRELFQGLQRD